MRSVTLTVATLAIVAQSVLAQNCQKTSAGLVPLSDLGTGKYQGFTGGLYTGQNTPPAGHLAAGIAEAKAITALDKNGKPDATNGRIVLISIGMSNTTQEFSTWVKMSNSDPKRRGTVRVIDCAQGGQDATKVSDPNAQFWTVALQRITNAGLTAAQVQAAWIKEAIARPTKGFPGSTTELQGYLVKIAQILRSKFPNLRICYLSSRIYAGYATTTLNPEPYAYESGFAVQWTIAQQVAGDPALNFDPNKGTVRAPWLAWGPYMWADGLKGRKTDSLIWECKDFNNDGTHPSTFGRQKVANLLDLHFTNDVTATPWYLGPGGGANAAVRPYGTGCPGSLGNLGVRYNGLPLLGQSVQLGFTGAPPQTPALLLVSGGKATIALDAKCTLLVDPSQLVPPIVTATNTSGRAIIKLDVPNDTQLLGGSVFAQFVNLDPQAPGLHMFGGGALSQGVELVLGNR